MRLVLLSRNRLATVFSGLGHSIAAQGLVNIAVVNLSNYPSGIKAVGN